MKCTNRRDMFTQIQGKLDGERQLCMTKDKLL